MLRRTIGDITSELTRETGCILIATIEHLDVVTTTAAVDLVVVAERVATQPICAALQVHLREMHIYGLPFWRSDADAAVQVVSAEKF